MGVKTHSNVPNWKPKPDLSALLVTDTLNGAFWLKKIKHT